MTKAAVALVALESRMRDETAAARAAINVALQHAANVGQAYEQVRDLLSATETQRWLGSSTCPIDRHTIMTMRRISMCDDLSGKARTLADLMFDAAAQHIAQGAPGRSRSENIEINRRAHQGATA